jgi:hypothetical protein
VRLSPSGMKPALDVGSDESTIRAVTFGLMS